MKCPEAQATGLGDAASRPVQLPIRAAQGQPRLTHLASRVTQAHFALTQKPGRSVHLSFLTLQPPSRAILRPFLPTQPTPHVTHQPFNPNQASPLSMQTPSRTAQAPSDAKRASLPGARVSPPAAHRQMCYLLTKRNKRCAGPDGGGGNGHTNWSPMVSGACVTTAHAGTAPTASVDSNR